MKNRIDFLDVLKGIGIIFVVWGHIPSDITSYIFSFHMPLFFLISGMFYKEDYDLKTLLKKRTNTLLIPFVFFYLIGFIWSAIFYYWGYRTFLHFDFTTIFDFLKGKEAFANTYVWFLWSLFMVNVFYWSILHFVKKRVLRWIIVIGIFIFGVFLSLNEINIPYFIDSSLFALFFFHVGFELKHFHFFMKRNKYDLFISLACFCLFLCFAIIAPSSCDMRINTINGPVYLFLLQCFSMIFCLFFLCKTIAYFYPLNYLGSNSLIILGIHDIILSFLGKLILEYSLTWMNTFYNVPFLLAALLLNLPIIYLLNKYFPFLIGKKTLIK